LFWVYSWNNIIVDSRESIPKIETKSAFNMYCTIVHLWWVSASRLIATYEVTRP
jgi:hypothetical protein